MRQRNGNVSLLMRIENEVNEGKAQSKTVKDLRGKKAQVISEIKVLKRIGNS